MTFASAVFLVLAATKESSDWARAKQEKQYANFPNMLGRNKTQQSGYCNRYMTQASSTGRGDPSKKLTYLHDQAHKRRNNTCFFQDLLMYGIVHNSGSFLMLCNSDRFAF